MSQDVIFGSTIRSWSRELNVVGDSSEPSTPAGREPLTEKEKDRIEKLAQLEMLATRGDVAAQKRMVEVNAAIATIQKRAKKGDTKSKRILSTLQESGLLTLSESPKGPRLVMAGASGRTRRPRQQVNEPQVDPAQQVQEFLLNLKMRAMAGDPQAMAVLQQYQQIITPPGASMPPEGAPMEAMPPAGAPMSGDDDERQARRQARRQKIQLLKTRAAAGDTEAVAALQILAQRRAERHSSSGFNGHLAFIRGPKANVGYNSHWAFIRGLGEEEVALAREGGTSERNALLRRNNMGWNPFKSAYRGIKKGVRATGRGLERAGKAAGHGLKDVALIVPQALSQANFASALSQGDDIGRTNPLQRAAWIAHKKAWMAKHHGELLENYNVKNAEQYLLSTYPNGIPFNKVLSLGRGLSNIHTNTALSFLIWRGLISVV